MFRKSFSVTLITNNEDEHTFDRFEFINTKSYSAILFECDVKIPFM